MPCFSLSGLMRIGAKMSKALKLTIESQGCLTEVQEPPALRRREDSRTAWRKYNPDSDPYDVRTAPIKPLSESEADEIAAKQIAALRRRIAMGGEESVLLHYETVVNELEASMLAPRSQGMPLKPPELRCRCKSGSSGVSDCSDFSTRCSERSQTDSRASSLSPRLQG
eukprot:TRINITY_DN18957_c0_g1_i1.p1 TRINITY_DN18957_c0_g1~~TRINITY_DN18957_c0_g1_i1.p1  ORF type:complete len:168 (+),score=25.01 TRINITY_DN18957_c0_g1_i1:110-613(+)